MSRISASVALAILVGIPASRIFAASPAATTPPATPGESVVPTLRTWQLDDDDDDDEKKPATSPATGPATVPATASTGGRYFLGLLDNRSSYGHDFFPDAFIGPEFDADRQVELNYAHTGGHGSRTDEVDGEVQWNLVGQLSVAAEIGWDSEHRFGLHGLADGDDENSSSAGFESVDLAVYHPVFEYVSDDRFLDYTAVLRLDVGIPTRTAASGKEAMLTPYLGQLVRLGEHVTVEGWTGWQFTLAPNQETELIYGANFGYKFRHGQLPFPWMKEFSPMFELDGTSPMSGAGQDALLGVAGFEATFYGLGDGMQFQLGYQFPLDSGGHDQLQWGIITGVFFEF